MSWFEVSDEQARALRLAFDCSRDLAPEASRARCEAAMASSLGMPVSAAAWRQLADVRNEEAAAWA